MQAVTSKLTNDEPFLVEFRTQIADEPEHQWVFGADKEHFEIALAWSYSPPEHIPVREIKDIAPPIKSNTNAQEGDK